MSLRRVVVRVSRAEREQTIARLIDLAPDGFEEVDLETGVELAVYTGDSGERAVRAAFPDAVAFRVAPGWEDRWREFHHAVTAGGIWVGPPWESPPPGLPSVVIDPGRAFGTGAHPTTRLCIELLAELATRGSVLDVGCGSGVLAIAAARLGFEPVLAIDIDPVAVDVTRSNVAVNRVAIDARLADASARPLPEADVVVANIALTAVEAVLVGVNAADAITAGYLESEHPTAAGWMHVARRALDGWAADHFRRESV